MLQKLDFFLYICALVLTSKIYILCLSTQPRKGGNIWFSWLATVLFNLGTAICRRTTVLSDRITSLWNLHAETILLLVSLQQHEIVKRPRFKALIKKMSCLFLVILFVVKQSNINTQRENLQAHKGLRWEGTNQMYYLPAQLASGVVTD